MFQIWLVQSYAIYNTSLGGCERMVRSDQLFNNIFARERERERERERGAAMIIQNKAMFIHAHNIPKVNTGCRVQNSKNLRFKLR